MATEVTGDAVVPADDTVPANHTVIEMTQIETLHSDSSPYLSQFSTDRDIIGLTPLHRACMDSNHDDVDKLLHNESVDIYATDSFGCTPLHYACEGGDKRIVKLLILKCAGCLTHDLHGIEVPISIDLDVQSKIKQFINCTDYSRHTPLVIVCEKGHTEIVKLLLKHGANVEVTHGLGRTPLGIACGKGHTEIVNLLLEHKADITITDISGRTPLGITCYEGHKEIVNLLLKHGANVNVTDKFGRTPLFFVRTEIFKLLLKHGADANVADNYGNTPLGNACYEGHTETVELLLKQDGVDVNDTNEDKNTLLSITCMKGHTETVELLLKQKGVDINHTNEDKETPLVIACRNRHTETVKLLLKHGADVNVTDRNQETLLVIAYNNRDTRIVKLLLEHKADVNVTDRNQETLLVIACSNRDTVIMKLLLEHGADVNVTDRYKETSLVIACSSGHTEIVKILLEHGANVKVIDRYEKTPLYIACRKGHTEIVKLLLEHGTICDYIIVTNALDTAVAYGQKDAAMAIVKSDKWEDALRNYTVVNRSDDGGIIRSILSCFKGLRKRDDSNDSDDDANKSVTQFKTPMRRIIEKMPDVAKVVFDCCCETKNPPYHPDYEITYNYEFLEDFDLDRQTPEEDAPSGLTRNEDENESSDVKRSNEKWPPKSKYSSQNHCLNILAHSPSKDLLKHPLVATLLDEKWNKYGRLVYYTNLFFYFLFVILLTSFALTVSPPNSSKCMEILGNDTDTFIGCFSQGRFVYVSIVSVFVIVYSTIMLIRELVQIILFRLQYLTSFVNYIEVSLFIFTIMFASVHSSHCYCTRSWQWQFGVIAVFLSWIALVFSIRKLPVVGIYVVMFIKIFSNFIKVVILALLLISAFAVPFYMVFYDPQDRAEGIRTPFITPWRTIIKTITMIMGEYEMDSLLRQDNQRNAPDIQYPVVAFSLIIVFVILMPILFLNLLTGLAVGDAEEIRRSADTYSRILRVEFTLPVEEFLRSIKTWLPKNLEQVIEHLVTCRKIQKRPKEKKKGMTHAIQEYFKTETEESVDEVKNKSKPLSEEMKDLHSAVSQKVKDLNSSITSVSQEVKDLRSSVSEEVKDLRSSMDQLLDIVNSMRKEIQGGSRGGGRAGGAAGVQEVEEEEDLN